MCFGGVRTHLQLPLVKRKFCAFVLSKLHQQKTTVMHEGLRYWRSASGSQPSTQHRRGRLVPDNTVCDREPFDTTGCMSLILSSYLSARKQELENISKRKYIYFTASTQDLKLIYTCHEMYRRQHFTMVPVCKFTEYDQSCVSESLQRRPWPTSLAANAEEIGASSVDQDAPQDVLHCV